MDNAEITKALLQFPLGNLCNAHADVRAMNSSIGPLHRGMKIAGRAKTAKIKPGENAAIHRAVHSAEPGEILVVDGRGDKNFGPFGDILALACQTKGVRGIVIDSTVRDSADIRKMRFPVFCLGVNPTATSKLDFGSVDLAVFCGGVCVAPGDFIAADDDGVVVVPQAIAAYVVEQVRDVAKREEAIKARLAKGETTAEIFQLV